MTIEEGLFAYLSGLAALTAKLDTRIYPEKMPDQATFPNLVYKKLGGGRLQTHQGKTGLAQRRFQLSIRHPDFKTANDVAEIVADAMDGYSGAMGNLPKVDAQVDNEIDFEEPDTRLHHCAVDVLLWYRR